MVSAPLQTGAIAPSGPRLAAAMAAETDPDQPGVVVELGPGTGVVTEALIARGFAPERLVLLEFNPDFCALLASRFPGIRVIEADAYAIAEQARIHVLGQPAAVVSGLPLLNQPLERRVALISAALALGRPSMPFVQFSYGIGPPVPAGTDGLRVDPVRRVWRNLPPAAVWVYRAAGG